ncbi:MAG: hypothetical protein ABIH20_03910, partial [Candidatus Diapherotrites archaeon]
MKPAWLGLGVIALLLIGFVSSQDTNIQNSPALADGNSLNLIVNFNTADANSTTPEEDTNSIIPDENIFAEETDSNNLNPTLTFIQPLNLEVISGVIKIIVSLQNFGIITANWFHINNIDFNTIITKNILSVDINTLDFNNNLYKLEANVCDEEKCYSEIISVTIENDLNTQQTIKQQDQNTSIGVTPLDENSTISDTNNSIDQNVAVIDANNFTEPENKDTNAISPNQNKETHTAQKNNSNNQISFDRHLDCHRCGQHKAPPNTEINMTISVTDANVNNTFFVDYFPVEWEIVDANNGLVESFDSEYNKISWEIISPTTEIEKSYVVKSPSLTSPPTKYSFYTELGAETSALWNIIVADPETLYLTSGAGDACGVGSDEALSGTAGASNATKLVATTGDSWTFVESARSIATGTWDVYLDLTHDNSGGQGSERDTRVLLRHMNSSCVEQAILIDVTQQPGKGATAEFTFEATSVAQIDYTAGDILLLEVFNPNAAENTVYYNNSTSAYDSRIVHPAEIIPNVAPDITGSITNDGSVYHGTAITFTGACTDAGDNFRLVVCRNGATCDSTTSGADLICAGSNGTDTTPS